jgi:hypothetical protein
MMSGHTMNVDGDATSATTTLSDERSGRQPEAASGHDAYNYQRFRFWPACEGIHRGVTAGTTATDETLYTLDGEAV